MLLQCHLVLNTAIRGHTVLSAYKLLGLWVSIHSKGFFICMIIQCLYYVVANCNNLGVNFLWDLAEFFNMH